ncbi:MAG: transcription elongation protein SprT [Alphaproteobacteria bacterium]
MNLSLAALLGRQPPRKRRRKINSLSVTTIGKEYNMKTENTHTTRESWLRSGTDQLRSYFQKFGYTLPDNIRNAIAFPSSGKRGRVVGECWHPVASEDRHFEIIIRADIADPVEVLSVLVQQLIRTLLPPSAKYGKDFKTIARRLGLEGKMREAVPGPILKERLNALAANLGPLPHAKLNFLGLANAPKKQQARMFKAECPVCDYLIRLSAKNVKKGLPVCPVDPSHGAFVCPLPDDDEGDDEITTIDGEQATIIEGV